MPVQALAQITPARLFNFQAPIVGEAQRLNTQVGGLSVSNDFSGRLSVTTAEGDTITLTADFETDFRALDFSSQGTVGSVAVGVDARHAEFMRRNAFGVAVEGDLNEQELRDLEQVFRKVTNIFQRFFQGQDEHALQKTVQLADRFANLSSLASLDLSVDVERSVTIVASQVVSELFGHPVPASPTETDTPGEAPVAADISPSRANGAASTTPSTPTADPTDEIRLGRPDSELSHPLSLAEQILNVFRESHLEPRRIREYLPSLFERLREELGRELQGRREHGNEQETESSKSAPTRSVTGTAVVFAYQSVRESTVSVSVHT